MFLPHTDIERKAMLKTIGLNNLEDLFQVIPAKYRFPKIDLPEALTEMEALALAEDLSSANETTHDLLCFLGAGAYHHYVPAVIDSILRRAEFYTAYTPYQPEVSQGTLQAIFEYQSLISSLTGMDVSNASHYDGATATAEAFILAYHHFRGKRSKFILSPAVHPHYRQTIRTYMNGFENIIITGDEENSDPLSSPDTLKSKIDSNTALVVVQYPDFFGRLYDYADLARVTHEAGALFAVVTNPIALGLFKTPAKFDADIVMGEGQPLGIPLSFGGPYLGFFSTKKEYVRKIAGRLVGETTDSQGRRGYVLTLTAREQHIRRDKATSNICTNQGLMALASTVYLSALGKNGLKQVAELCYHKAHYAAENINSIKNYKTISSEPFFHEFIVQCPKPVEDINLHLLDHGILGGYDLKKDFPQLSNHMLVAVTETITKEEIDLFCNILEEVSHD